MVENFENLVNVLIKGLKKISRDLSREANVWIKNPKLRSELATTVTLDNLSAVVKEVKSLDRNKVFESVCENLVNFKNALSGVFNGNELLGSWITSLTNVKKKMIRIVKAKNKPELVDLIEKNLKTPSLV
ncbi:hypothetical protein B6U93_00670 [Candidatus Woesearchaeota archaeon ex4484_78]|nr:MAG: hypothetical protein B6U93_00670 [Candidatus Woesearchaeota archaeon ex4484_78]